MWIAIIDPEGLFGDLASLAVKIASPFSYLGQMHHTELAILHSL